MMQGVFLSRTRRTSTGRSDGGLVPATLEGRRGAKLSSHGVRKAVASAPSA
jgi:hypothetical protein